MIDPEDWGDQLPAETQSQLQKILWDNSREGVAVLTSERTQYLLAKHHQLGKILKRTGSVRIPLLGRLTLGK